MKNVAIIFGSLKKFEGKEIERRKVEKIYQIFLLFGCLWKFWEKEN